MKTKSLITNLVYDTKSIIKIKNPKQAAKYVSNGCTLYDIIVDADSKFVFIFDRDEASHYFVKWIEGTL